MKKIISLAAVFIMLTSAGGSASADNGRIAVKVNEQTLSFDTDPIIFEDRTFVPIRNVCEALGADVYWDDTHESVYIVKNDTKLRLKPYSNLLIKVSCKSAKEFMDMSGENIIEMDVFPIIFNGRTLLPVRAVCEALGASVEWNSADSTVNILCSDDILNNVNTDKDFFDDMISYFNTHYKKAAGNIVFADADNNTILTKEHIAEVGVGYDDSGYYVELVLTSEGQRLFSEATDKISKEPNNDYISVILNGSVITAPHVTEKIDSERVIIQGSFSPEQANSLADMIAGL